MNVDVHKHDEPRGVTGKDAGMDVTKPQSVYFTAWGKPQTAGSKRAFPFKKKDGKLGVSVSDDNQNGKAWRSVVIDACREAYNGPKLTGPLQLIVHFIFARPQGHFGTGRNAGKLKDSAPRHKTTKPDATKCLRCLEDALNGVLWNDDSQVVSQIVSKKFGDKPCAIVRVHQMEGTDAKVQA